MITMGEAEVFAQHGFDDIFIANQIVTPQKIARLCALARNCRVTVAVGNPVNVKDLSDAASHTGVTLNVVVDIHTRLQRCGVEPGRPAIDLAKAISSAEHLEFMGLMTYEGAILGDDRDELIAESRKCIQRVLDTRQMVEAGGIDVRLVSVGGTHNYEIAGDMPGVTEVPAGAYALMDQKYRRHRPQFTPAAKVIATVTSHPEPDTAITDAGQKAVGIDNGMAVVEGIKGATVKSMSAEHGSLTLEGAAQNEVDLGYKVWVTPWDIGGCVNVYDYIHASRNGRLEAVWDVAARGRYR